MSTAATEDAQLVRAMNRLRRAYVDLAPEVGPYLTASTHDDVAGLTAPYTLGMRRSPVSHVMASTAFFMLTVNSLVAGALGALIAFSATASTPLTVAIGVVAGGSFAVAQLEFGRRSFALLFRDVRFPSS